MTFAQLRDHVEHSSRQQDPVVQATRRLFDEYDRLRKQFAEYLVNYPRAEQIRMDFEISEATVRALRREVQRLRREIDRLHPAPWEIDQ